MADDNNDPHLAALMEVYAAVGAPPFAEPDSVVQAVAQLRTTTGELAGQVSHWSAEAHRLRALLDEGAVLLREGRDWADRFRAERDDARRDLDQLRAGVARIADELERWPLTGARGALELRALIEPSPATSEAAAG